MKVFEKKEAFPVLQLPSDTVAFQSAEGAGQAWPQQTPVM
jgi:hypothetical protein